MKTNEEVIIDENLLVKNKKTFSLGVITMDREQHLILYSIDFSGQEKYKIYTKEISSNKIMDDYIKNTTGDAVWHQKIQGYYYIKLNPRFRGNKIYFHLEGCKPNNYLFKDKR